jgi:hypothetical protein
MTFDASAHEHLCLGFTPAQNHPICALPWLIFSKQSSTTSSVLTKLLPVCLAHMPYLNLLLSKIQAFWYGYKVMLKLNRTYCHPVKRLCNGHFVSFIGCLESDELLSEMD